MFSFHLSPISRQSPALFVFLFSLWLLPSMALAQPSSSQKWWRFSGFLDTGFALAYEPNTETIRPNWALNEIELQFQMNPLKSLEGRLAINFLPGGSNTSLMDQLVQEAWLRLKFETSAKLLLYLEAGRFFAFPGWDSLNTIDRYQITPTFQNEATPNTFTGLKIGLQSGKIDAYLFLSNGWDNLTELDTEPTVGLVGTMELPFSGNALTLGASVINGKEPNSFTSRARLERVTLVELQVTFKTLNERLLLGLGFTMVFASSGEFWYTGMATAHYKILSRLGLTLTYSRLSDPDRLQTLLGSERDQFNIALRAEPIRHLILLAEYRIDLSEGNLQQHFWGVKGILHFQL